MAQALSEEIAPTGPQWIENEALGLIKLTSVESCRTGARSYSTSTSEDFAPKPERLVKLLARSLGLPGGGGGRQKHTKSTHWDILQVGKALLILEAS